MHAALGYTAPSVRPHPALAHTRTQICTQGNRMKQRYDKACNILRSGLSRRPAVCLLSLAMALALIQKTCSMYVHMWVLRGPFVFCAYVFHKSKTHRSVDKRTHPFSKQTWRCCKHRSTCHVVLKASDTWMDGAGPHESVEMQFALQRNVTNSRMQSTLFRIPLDHACSCQAFTSHTALHSHRSVRMHGKSVCASAWLCEHTRAYSPGGHVYTRLLGWWTHKRQL